MNGDPGLSTSTRRNNYKGGYTPEVLHEPFQHGGGAGAEGAGSSSGLSANIGYGNGGALDDVPLTASPRRGSLHENAPLSSSIRKHVPNKRSISVQQHQQQQQQQQYAQNGGGQAYDDGYYNSSTTISGFPGSSRASSAASSPRLERVNNSGGGLPSDIGMGPPPGQGRGNNSDRGAGFFKHKVIPSLTSGVPPVLSSIRPKGWPAASPTLGSSSSFGGGGAGASSTGLSASASNSSSSSAASSAAAAAAAQKARWDTPTAWIAYYFVANLSLTLYNKLLMNKFPFAWSLTAMHALSGCIGAQICLSRGLFTQQRLTTRENLVLVSFSSLYTVNIAVSNLSLNLVTVPFHQVVRAMTPLFTILLATIFLRKRSSKATWLSLIPVVAGVVFATYGDYYFTTWGLILTLLGTVLAAMKTIVTNMILVGRLKLHPLDLLLRMSPLALIQCLVASWWTGELGRVREFTATQMTYSGFAGLAVNGAIAFFLNVVSFTANKKTSALTMTVAANVKQVLTIVLAVMIFHLHINVTNLFGITLTLLGGALYAKVEFDQKNAKAAGSTANNGAAGSAAGTPAMGSVGTFVSGSNHSQGLNGGAYTLLEEKKNVSD